MKRLRIILSVIIFAVICIVIFLLVRRKETPKGVSVIYPFNSALFPPEFPSPTFEWNSETKDPASSWEITLMTGNKKHLINATTRETRWTPAESEWDSIKVLSDFKKIYFRVRKRDDKKLSAKISLSVSRDSVGAPILYRQMPIPFFMAERQLDSMNYILIDPGSKDPPHIAMRGFPVCGNCHSFSADGKTVGLDLDGGRRDKGGYFLTQIRDTVMFNVDTYMSWSKLERRSTFGMFSKLSPDGRYIVTTVKDRVVSRPSELNNHEDFAYSLLFFPVNGHLAVYDRQTRILKELPGANFEEYVQSNAFWTPDGKTIIFSRAEALPRDSSNLYEVAVQDNDMLDQFAARKRPFKFDLYAIPFNDGEGGTAVPIKGASNNGKSNFFPAVSPDGKWLIYCQAEDFMLLMPDSRLYIVPAGGGKARMLKCNLYSLNSWHAWSPNSKWTVFVSKGLSVFTDMFLTHIDEKGNASIPVLMDKAREYQRVCNYPEFVNLKPHEKFVMEYDYVELAHIKTALRDGKTEEAKQLFERLMSQHPFLFSEDYAALSIFLLRMGLKEESKRFAEMSRSSINSFLPEEE